MVIDQSNTRTDTFQWRLIDLEGVLDGFANKYGKYYMNKVSFKCGLKKVYGVDFMAGGLSMNADWSCAGYLSTSPTTS